MILTVLTSKSEIDRVADVKKTKRATSDGIRLILSRGVEATGLLP